MVRGERIKEFIFPQQSYSATTTSTVYSDNINGEILSIGWNSNITGSTSLTVSGTALQIWRRNAPSGTAWQHGVPREFSQSATGSIAGAEAIPFVINGGPIGLNVGSALSGTSAALNVSIKYR